MSEDPIRDPHGLRKIAGVDYREYLLLTQLERYLVEKTQEIREQKRVALTAAIDGMAAAAEIDRAELREGAKS